MPYTPHVAVARDEVHVRPARISQITLDPRALDFERHARDVVDANDHVRVPEVDRHRAQAADQVRLADPRLPHLDRDAIRRARENRRADRSRERLHRRRRAAVVLVEIARDAPHAVPTHLGFAAIRVHDAHARVVRFRGLNERPARTRCPRRSS
jgi:hypothetical protein